MHAFKPVIDLERCDAPPKAALLVGSCPIRMLVLPYSVCGQAAFRKQLAVHLHATNALATELERRRRREARLAARCCAWFDLSNVKANDE
jgi:hypothetical protein